jgi:hypothetical protein
MDRRAFLKSVGVITAVTATSAFGQVPFINDTTWVPPPLKKSIRNHSWDSWVGHLSDEIKVRMESSLKAVIDTTDFYVARKRVTYDLCEFLQQTQCQREYGLLDYCVVCDNSNNPPMINVGGLNFLSDECIVVDCYYSTIHNRSPGACTCVRGVGLSKKATVV